MTEPVRTIKVLRVTTGGEVEMVRITTDFRHLARSIKADSIERVRTRFPDIMLYVDEEGLLKPDPRLNLKAMLFYPGRIVGDVLITGEVMTNEGADIDTLPTEAVIRACQLMGVDPEPLVNTKFE